MATAVSDNIVERTALHAPRRRRPRPRLPTSSRNYRAAVPLTVGP